MAESTYRAAVDAQRIQQIRQITRDLPASCADFMRGIAMTTSTFTRLAYALDLRTFFHYLRSERVAFANKPLTQFDDADIGRISQSDLEAYVEYLSLYFKDSPTETTDHAINRPVVNHELAIKRKLSSLRSYFDYMFRSKRLPSNVTQLVALPKIHEKPILRLTLDEMQKMLEMSQTGADMTKGQQKFHQLTATRDYAMLSLFLGTGIRVSECVGLNLRMWTLPKMRFSLPARAAIRWCCISRRRLQKRFRHIMTSVYRRMPCPAMKMLSFLACNAGESHSERCRTW